MNGSSVTNKIKYVSTAAAAKYFGVSHNTIRLWDSKGFIKTVRINGSLNGHRRYDISSFSGTINTEDNQHIVPSTNTISAPVIEKPIKRGIIYARVSSRHQTDDIQRQIAQLQEAYPTYEIIKDVGSGINFKRAGFLKLIERAIKRDFDELVVAHKDRFCRFAFDFFKWLVSQYGISFVVLNEPKEQSYEQELAEDLLSIIHVFTNRPNGRRKYKQASHGATYESINEDVDEASDCNNDEAVSNNEITTASNEQDNKLNKASVSSGKTVKTKKAKTNQKSSIVRQLEEIV